jgi:hypothetical protein
MSWFFSKKVDKNEFEQFEKAVQTGFSSAKQDITNISTWIKHLDSNNSKIKEEILELHDDISTLKSEIENIKNMIGILGNKEVFKQKQTVFNKQTVFKPVLNGVQTAVQTGFLDNLSSTERAIIFVLLNSGDMKLSYEDLAAMLGKNKGTIRGQINSIRQKNEGLIEEQISEGNKKRVYIPDKTKEILVKRVNLSEKTKKSEGKE